MNYLLFSIKNWQHNPHRRKHRFRCQQCQIIIKDGSDLVIEKRGKSSHGYHLACFCKQDQSRGAIARNPENALKILDEVEVRSMIHPPSTTQSNHSSHLTKKETNHGTRSE